MQHFVTINKKSPVHKLWRTNNIHRAKYLDTLFTFNKVSGQYEATGNFPEIGKLMKSPHIHVDIISAPIGQAKITSPIPTGKTSTLFDKLKKKILD